MPCLPVMFWKQRRNKEVIKSADETKVSNSGIDAKVIADVGK